MGQSVSPQAVALGLGTVIVGAFDDTEVKEGRAPLYHPRRQVVRQQRAERSLNFVVRCSSLRCLCVLIGRMPYAGFWQE